MFFEDCEGKDFKQKKEAEEIPDSAIFVLENLNFKPHEASYVEPEKPPEEPEPSGEEKARLDEIEEAKNALAGKTGKKLPAAEKKRLEEFLKKVQEEDDKKKAELAAKNTVSEEEKAEKEARDAEEARLKAEREHFDFKTVHKFKEDLGQYGDLYVNDALMASLS